MKMKSEKLKIIIEKYKTRELSIRTFYFSEIHGLLQMIKFFFDFRDECFHWTADQTSSVF